MTDLRTRFGAVELKNPILTASGTFGYGSEFAELTDLSRIGGLATRRWISVAPAARSAPILPRVVVPRTTESSTTTNRRPRTASLMTLSFILTAMSRLLCVGRMNDRPA